jgi:hypothetical protein
VDFLENRDENLTRLASHKIAVAKACERYQQLKSPAMLFQAKNLILDAQWNPSKFLFAREVALS